MKYVVALLIAAIIAILVEAIQMFKAFALVLAAVAGFCAATMGPVK